MVKVAKENTAEANRLKAELIKELATKKIKYIDVINYYYDIIDANRNGGE